ncbi:hypothetical protein RUS47_02775 [Mycoplasmoides gallisepticum]|uniref:hypothetical protein n=1 Tax=Mycoplasmoides gallisepticum TaxID=2096 RepID=UPI00124726FA|nr:hypothetical protein [Mycoplasmoides gallisepticum]QEX47432.1 hypothetical protein F6J63_02775 [Mycoplasmoides gallisepticum]ULH62042.1 hypothetical protein MHC98_02825 [Mycoplasmoides gallisepticum]ULH68110.1 hypothetical protein MHC99_02820 [Mycoplasmoides gallisepticum]WGG23708.1 hypothetical protein P0D30_02850 [Mycoplasmoides gallisepticum]WGG24499.1 hypothetical protein P0D28_02825 [Mycoplasmoides gallisepticum]
MVNDNSTVILAKLSNYLSNLNNAKVKEHCSLIKKQNSFAISSFAFLFLSAFLGLLLTVNVFVILWTSYHQKIDYDDQEAVKLLLTQFETNWLISKVLVSLLLISLVILISLISFGYYFNNYKQLDTPIKEIKKPVNFINRISLVCACFAIFLVSFGYFIFFIYSNDYHNAIKRKQAFDYMLKLDSIVNARTLISAILGILFCLALILLIASFLVYSVFSVQYHYFSSLDKLRRAIIKLNAQTKLEEKVQASTKTNVEAEPIKEEVKVEPTQTTKINQEADLNELFKKFNKQPFNKSATQTQSVEPNTRTNQVDDSTVKAQQTTEYVWNTQQANPTQETKVNNNQNPTSSLKDIFKKMNSYTKTQTVNNQTGPAEQEVNQTSSTSTTNVSPADLYKNIFKFKSPLSATNEINNQKETSSVDENNTPKQEDYEIRVKSINQAEKQKEELKNLFKKIKNSKE